MKMLKRKLQVHTAPPVAFGRVRDTQLALFIRLLALFAVGFLAFYGLVSIVF